ncbi:MAG TPA: hypothetical protein VEA37_10780 [Flavobacterium sp.]|nr:hypothetical protein [Flavobacterium sp.]
MKTNKERHASATARLLSAAKSYELRQVYFEMLLQIKRKKLSKHQRDIAILLALYNSDLK